MPRLFVILLALFALLASSCIIRPRPRHHRGHHRVRVKVKHHRPCRSVCARWVHRRHCAQRCKLYANGVCVTYIKHCGSRTRVCKRYATVCD